LSTLADVRAIDAWARDFSLENNPYATIVVVRYVRLASSGVTVVQTSWAFLLVLGVLIFVHELGHFLVARWFGVRV
jgi:hypothetical protein